MKFDMETIQIITLFEDKTKTRVKDCVSEEKSLYFVVDNSKVGKAVGKGGENIRQLQRMTGKRVFILGFTENPRDFIKNVIPSVTDVEIDGEGASVTVPRAEKAVVIGKDRKNINRVRFMLSHLYGIKELSIK